MGRKISSKIRYPMSFNMQPVMDKAFDSPKRLKEEEEGVIYDLYGVVIHSGYTPTCGHYYSYCKTDTGRWYECDDSSISNVRSE